MLTASRSHVIGLGRIQGLLLKVLGIDSGLTIGYVGVGRLMDVRVQNLIQGLVS